MAVSYGMPFSDALRRTLDDLRRTCGVEVVWKDADPRWWARLPPALSQHRNPHCLAVKADRLRLARCIGIDALEAGDFASRAAYRIRTCPYGVTEVLVPIRSGGTYHGCCLVGPWRGTARVAAPQTLAALPPFPGRARAAALARLVAAACAPLALERSAGRAAEEAERDPLMAEVCRWIAANLSARLRVRDAARVAGLSPSRFVHRFAAACGTPFGPHVRRCLMEEAARRLAAGGVEVGTLASELGFATHARFSAAFRKAHGCSPREFRERRGA